MEEALAMSVGHSLSNLSQQTQLLIDRQRLAVLRQEPVKADRTGIMLKDQSRSEFRFTIVQHALNARVFNALQDSKLALRCSRKPIPSVGRSRIGVRIYANSAVDSGCRMASSEVLPILALGQDLQKLIIPDATATTGWPNSGLFDRAHKSARCVCVDPAATSHAKFVGANEGPN